MSASADPAERARRILARSGAWIEAVPAGYAVRSGPDRRARVIQVLDEAAFRRLIDAPGLKPRRAGGWIAQPVPRPTRAPAAGRPGVIEGVVAVAEPGGKPVRRRANLASSPVAWLASRRDAAGRPLLAPAEAAAATCLERDAEIALGGAALTMRWDGLPRSGSGGGSPRSGPGDAALSAGRRVEAALAACTDARAMVEHICIRFSTLQMAEKALGLRPRTGKTVLKAGLQRLARHYRLL